jgi:hypothetical protein
MKSLTIISYLAVAVCLTAAENYPKALKFKDDIKSHFMFKTNLQPIQNEFTLCSWVKKLRTEGIPSWFSYAIPMGYRYNVILVSDEGSFNHLFGFGRDVSRKVNIPNGSWFHYCESWKTEDKEQLIYFNGRLKEIRDLDVNPDLGSVGIVLIGNAQSSYGGSLKEEYIFGGELYKLNIFSRKLSRREIERMYGGGNIKEGLCSKVEDNWGSDKFLKWEDVMRESKKVGEVAEIDMKECDPIPVPSNKWDVLRSEPFYNRILTAELVEKLMKKCDCSMLG